MYTKDTVLDDNLDIQITPPPHEEIIPQQEGIEYYECQKCGEYNLLKPNPKARRTTRIRHMRLDNVVYASLKRYALVNNVTINYAIMLLLYNARTTDVSYLLTERHLVEKPQKKKQKKKNK